MSEIRLTVLTPLYNRKHTIHRVFDSLMRQTCKDFEWLVIDDGSTDGVEPLIREYIREADFPVRYYYKENGGKHTVVNMAYGLMETPYFTILDSDDAFTDTAVENMLAGWDGIPPQDRDKFWCVVGHSVDSETGERIGQSFSENANDLSIPREPIVGEKTAAIRTDVGRRFPFPEPEGTTFVTESVVWAKVDREYRQYLLNADFRIYYQNEPDSLTVAWYRDHVQQGYVSNFIWKQSVLNDTPLSAKETLKTVGQYTFYGVMARRKVGTILSGLEHGAHKLLSFLLLLPAYGVRLLRRLRAKTA